MENGTHTTLEFSRQYVTCDADNDLQMFDNEYEESNIVFAYSFSDPESIETVGEPDYQGVFYLNLFIDERIFEPKEKDLEEYSFWINVRLWLCFHVWNQIYLCHLAHITFSRKFWR